jgi:F-type H+-transporting ATPase subunit b
LGERASRLAVDIAAKLFERLPEEAQVDGFVNGLSNALASLPPETRKAFGASGDPILLRAPRALTKEETELCRRVLIEALGRPTEFRVEIDPSLIAGVELEERHVSVANSLRADLTKIATELAGHESARAE